MAMTWQQLLNHGFPNNFTFIGTGTTTAPQLPVAEPVANPPIARCKISQIYANQKVVVEQGLAHRFGPTWRNKRIPPVAVSSLRNMNSLDVETENDVVGGFYSLFDFVLKPILASILNDDSSAIKLRSPPPIHRQQRDASLIVGHLDPSGRSPDFASRVATLAVEYKRPSVLEAHALQVLADRPPLTADRLVELDIVKGEEGADGMAAKIALHMLSENTTWGLLYSVKGFVIAELVRNQVAFGHSGSIVVFSDYYRPFANDPSFGSLFIPLLAPFFARAGNLAPATTSTLVAQLISAHAIGRVAQGPPSHLAPPQPASASASASTRSISTARDRRGRSRQSNPDRIGDRKGGEGSEEIRVLNLDNGVAVELDLQHAVQIKSKGSGWSLAPLVALPAKLYLADNCVSKPLPNDLKARTKLRKRLRPELICQLQHRVYESFDMSTDHGAQVIELVSYETQAELEFSCVIGSGLTSVVSLARAAWAPASAKPAASTPAPGRFRINSVYSDPAVLSTQLVVKRIQRYHRSFMVREVLLFEEVFPLLSRRARALLPRYYGVLRASHCDAWYIVFEHGGEMVPFDLWDHDTCLMQKINEAFDVFAQAGIEHTDRRRENVLIRSDQSICIIDWGQARLAV